MIKKFKAYFYTGLIALLPIVLTVYIFNWIVGIMMSLLGNSFVTIIIKNILLVFVEEGDMDYYFQLLVYFISLVTMIIGTCLVGFTLKIVFFAKIIKKAKELFIKIPLIKQVYTTISQIIEVAVSDREKSYQKVVMVEYPRKGIYSIGFLTSEDNFLIGSAIGREEKVYNVFIPTSPNPTSGMFIVVPESEVKILDIKIDDAIKLIISGGVILPEKKEIEKIED
ncbi:MULTISPECIES: DUF502 domain-containing protein [Fusobacterium]|jgi:uncharacterized membrane protein|uniref:DUF502 domain-containing protein n=1 Tax=Fusobacterium mortiferum ATCC 9817 TaxID=469616 RepID=A0ABM6U003_FUSMR|nr:MULTISPECIES: DUF502 domain-containing protein [Fusobacterium]AVQ20022.1 DUF502 domain-containing protein [Fusobacterium mortiferum ATCC 9817]EEO35534.1 hypothetical protein FMAG_01096 [Fusobacterium mortiferum ATCC 9817]MCF2628013.1 DUF502 domain-containing protein [Fusobacterium mortiferum]MCF2699624.1 DUF502 domain-containing protein [Fusobacterium mortiferum]MCI6383058.1 DUF502 domain-containing protein [Fusobacterium mortiferum]